MATKFSDASAGRRPVAGCELPSGAQLSWAIAFGISLAVTTYVLKHSALPRALRYLISAAPLVLGVFYMRGLVRDTRRQLDEMQLRIYLEAGAVVVAGLFIILLVYPTLEVGQLVPPLDAYTVLAIISALGIIGYIAARRRYR